MERRLAAILAADVVGYSRLVREDEAGTLAALKAHFDELIEPKITERNGRIVKLMGDGLLAEFPSAVEAVQCAVEIQHWVVTRNEEAPDQSRIVYRIGINIGDIVVEGDDIYGDGVNVAARLEGLAEPGGICVARNVVDQVKYKLDFGFEDLGEQSVKNITEPVAVYRVLLDGQAPKIVRKPTGRGLTPIQLIAAALVVALIAAGGVSVIWQPWAPDVEPASMERMAFPLPDKPSLAVLPFTNLSDDSSQEYFADGMTEDLITDLSKISGLFVIARNSSFSYKGQQVKVRQVAEELGVRYVLEGSVRRAGDEVRINAQLIDATTGGHLWADRYDGTMDDVFDLQDKVARRIVAALALSLSPGETRTQREKETDVPAAYDAFLQGWAHFQKRTPEHYAKAVTYFENAAELDPNYARAFAALAWIYWNGRYGGWYVALGVDPNEAKRRADEFLDSAMVRPTPLAHLVKSSKALFRGRYEEAIAEAERAITLDANNSDSLVTLADVLIWNGTARDAMPLIDRARRLDPHNEAEYAYLQGIAQFGMDKFAAAATSFEKALELNPDLWSAQTACGPCVYLVSAYGHLERREDSTEMLKKLRKNHPGFLSTINPYWWPYKEPEDFERLATGLRKAGLPE